MEDHGIAMMADAAEGLVATERNLEEVLSDPALLQRVHYLLAALIEKIVLAPDEASATGLVWNCKGVWCDLPERKTLRCGVEGAARRTRLLRRDARVVDWGGLENR